MGEITVNKKLAEDVSSYINMCFKEAVLQKLKNVNINDFSDFNSSTSAPDSGTFSFKVEQKYLKEVVKIINTTSHVNVKYIGLKIFKDLIKFHAFNQTVFSEIIISTIDACDIEDSVSGNISFFVDKELLNKIASRFDDDVIKFIYKADVDSLEVSSGNTKLELNITGRDVKFVNYHAKLQNPKYVCKVDSDCLKDAVKYISYFVTKNEVKKNLSQADLKGKLLYGGSYSSVGIYKSDKFDLMDLNIKYESLTYLYKVLPYFNKNNLHLFETENYYLLRDENIYFGFEKSMYVFPSIEKFLIAKVSGDSFKVSRRSLLNSLNKLAIVSLSSSALLKLKILSVTDHLVLYLYVKDRIGKISKDMLMVNLEGSFESFTTGKVLEFIVSFNTFKDVVAHFDSEEVELKYILNKALVIKDVNNGSEAISNFSLFSENHLNKA